MAFELSPVTREELFLAKLAGRDVTPPDPVTRQELFYSALTGASVTLPAPVTREELYLAKIAGMEVDIPSEPKTRKEIFLAAIAGESVTPPDPLTRIEALLAEWLENGGDELVSVSGTAPLSLPNAVAKPIASLVQYGKCEQSGTPTPTAPASIKCNNGELGLVDDELPSGYKRITGIKFDGDFWYDTGEKLTGDDDVTMTLSDTSSSGQNVFGSYNGTTSGTKNFSLYLYGGGSTSGCYLRYGEQLLRPKFGTDERTITFGKSGTSGFTTDVSATPETFTTEANAYIGMLPNSSSPAYTGSITGNILVGSRLKWIPCERVSDGVVGYYEAVKGIFLEPTGTGTPVKGNYDTTHLVLGIIGTPEVLTIGEQTAALADLLGVVRSGGLGQNYADSEDIISGAVTRNWAIKAFDGTEDWTYSSQKGYYQCKISGAYTTGDQYLMCTHGVWKTNSNNTLDDHWTMSSGYVRFYPSTTFASADAFKAWVKECWDEGEPIILVYRLKTPVSESATPYALSTAEGNNTVSITAGVSGIKLDAQYNARPE